MSAPQARAHTIAQQLRRTGRHRATINATTDPDGRVRVQLTYDTEQDPSQLIDEAIEARGVLMRLGYRVQFLPSDALYSRALIVTPGDTTPAVLDELRAHAPRGFHFTPNPDLPAEPCGYCAMKDATVVLRVYGRPHPDDAFGDAMLDGCRACAPAILAHMHGANHTDHDLEAEYRP